jgi:hypothetical protein
LAKVVAEFILRKEEYSVKQNAVGKKEMGDGKCLMEDGKPSRLWYRFTMCKP